jgi:AcrR family transcriptional regulator
MARKQDGAVKAGRRRTADARSKILEAGLAVFADEGFAGTTTRAIAGRAGVNLGLIMYYFGSKDALWRAVVDRVFEDLGKELGDVTAEAARGREAVVDLVERAIRFMARNPAFVRLMNDECKRNSARMRWLVDRHGRGLYETITALFASLKRAGLAADVPDIHAYYMFVGAAGMLFSQAPECKRLVGKDPTKDERLMSAHADAIVRVFLPR